MHCDSGFGSSYASHAARADLFILLSFFCREFKTDTTLTRLHFGSRVRTPQCRRYVDSGGGCPNCGGSSPSPSCGEAHAGQHRSKPTDCTGLFLASPCKPPTRLRQTIPKLYNNRRRDTKRAGIRLIPSAIMAAGGRSLISHVVLATPRCSSVISLFTFRNAANKACDSCSYTICEIGNFSVVQIAKTGSDMVPIVELLKSRRCTRAQCGVVEIALLSQRSLK